MGVTADTRSTHGLLIKLEQFRHRLLGHFHSHPGNGAEATQPSGTDTGFQKRLESAGHVVWPNEGAYGFNANTVPAFEAPPPAVVP